MLKNTDIPKTLRFVGETSLKKARACAKMRPMKTLRLLILFGCVLGMVFPVRAQEDADLLNRINNLRASVGVSGYTRNSILDAAARNQAQWLVNTGQISHTQSDGSTPRTRAAAAGYPSTWVSENIYAGTNASVGSAWNFWINSPIHYRGLTSPNYVDVGIGIASGDWGRAYVLVFGNATGSWSPSGGVSTGGGSSASSGGGSAGSVSAPPSFVVGVDARGYIMHEVQAGDTLGDIALIYGYTWDDIPTMLEVNHLTEDDARVLEVGSVFLVPPQSGTYTPTPEPATHTPTATPPPTETPEGALIEAVAFTESAPIATPYPTETPPRIATAGAPDYLLNTVTVAPTLTATMTATPQTVAVNDAPNADAPPQPTRTITQNNERPLWLLITIGVWAGILIGVGVMWLRQQFTQ